LKRQLWQFLLELLPKAKNLMLRALVAFMSGEVRDGDE
jgi:hypothetical protein